MSEKHTPGPWSVFGEDPIPRNVGIEADSVTFSIVVWGDEHDDNTGHRHTRRGNAGFISLGLVFLFGMLALGIFKVVGITRHAVSAASRIEGNRTTGNVMVPSVVLVGKLDPEVKIGIPLPQRLEFWRQWEGQHDGQVIRLVRSDGDIDGSTRVLSIRGLVGQRPSIHFEADECPHANRRGNALILQLPCEPRRLPDNKWLSQLNFTWNHEWTLSQHRCASGISSGVSGGRSLSQLAAHDGALTAENGVLTSHDGGLSSQQQNLKDADHECESRYATSPVSIGRLLCFLALFFGGVYVALLDLNNQRRRWRAAQVCGWLACWGLGLFVLFGRAERLIGLCL